MLPLEESRSRKSNLFDNSDSYGWVSIVLHWLIALALCLVWYFGKSVSFADAFDPDLQRSLHVSIAAMLWLIIFVRIVWRFKQGHPKLVGQSTPIHRVAVLVHYSLLLAVLLMLISGPTFIWASGQSIHVFDWFSLPSPFTTESTFIAVTARAVHATSSLILLILVLLHIAGALKHLMFSSDETFIRMITPRENSKADNSVTNASPKDHSKNYSG